MLDVAHGQLADNERSQTIPENDERHRQGEGKGAQDAVQGKGSVDDFQVHDFGEVGTPTVDQFPLGLFGALLEAVGNEKGRRADHGAKGHVWIHAHGHPDHRAEEHRSHGIEPDALLQEEMLVRQADLLFLAKQPVQEEEDQENATTNQEHRRGRVDGRKHDRVTAEGGRQTADRPQAGAGDPDDGPGQEAANDEDREQQAPEQKPAPRLGPHGGQDLGVDDGIVDTAHGFEQGQAENGQRQTEDIHASSIAHNYARVIPNALFPPGWRNW